MSKEHLRPPWKPGQSGNPKGINGWTKQRQAMAELFGEMMSRAERQDFAEKMVELAKKGNPAAIKLLGDKLFGPEESIVHTPDLADMDDASTLQLIDDMLSERRSNTNGSGKPNGKGNGHADGGGTDDRS